MIGHTVGHYRILERLGGGGMGVVYKAEDTKLGRMVALKFLPPELTRDPDAKSRFLREARAASLLDHSNICTIYEIGDTDDEQTFIAMACYDGETLKARIERGAVETDEAMKIAEQIARGLAVAHDAGIVHRDIKPANVMLTAKGVAKILDFGLAKLTGATHITQSKTTLGTLAYMAPEQLRGDTVGPQADLWALGVVLFELLTGQRPFRGDYEQAMAYSILNEQPVSLLELKPDAPADLERIVKKLLRKDPLQRYQTAEEVLAEFGSLQRPGSGSGSGSGSGKAGPHASRPREPLRSGARLGPYEIAEPLGSGGMGDVYRARDTRLDRQVAIKVLAPEFSEDAERKQRFQREAKTISSLSHPNICTLFDVGEQEGTDFLVMEYLEGETLADRLTKGALPLNDLLKIGIQIGEALGAAHRQGVIHRDLKPGNVMLTKAGAVKLVDFGLAKDIGAVTSTPRHPSTPDKPLTAEGAIVGTLAYMAPEQVEGREADARTDIFAFGAILYEMATGKRAFEGATKASLIAAVLDREPLALSDARDRMGRNSESPGAVLAMDHIVRRCLEKNAERRWQSALDVASELRWIEERRLEDGSRPEGRSFEHGTRRWKRIALMCAVAAMGLAAFLSWTLYRQRNGGSSHDSAGTTAFVSRTSIDLRESAPIASNESPPLIGFVSPLLALSHDGRVLVYVGAANGRMQLYRRQLDSARIEPIDGTVGAYFACFSPDDKWIAFLAGDQLFKVELRGGNPILLANVPTAVRAVWHEDRSIVVMVDQAFQLARVPESGGSIEFLTPKVGNVWGEFTDILPGGQVALARQRNRLGGDFSRSVLVDLRTMASTTLIERGFDARFLSGKWVTYVAGSNLYAVAVDLVERKALGNPVLLQSGVANESILGQAQYSIARNGALAFVPGGDRSIGGLCWMDEHGTEDRLKLPAALYGVLDLAPGGRQLAAEMAGVNDAIALVDLDRQQLRQLAVEGDCRKPAWTSAGRLAFSLKARDGSRFQVVSTSDAGSEMQVIDAHEGYDAVLESASSDGRTFLVQRQDPQSSFWVLQPNTDTKPRNVGEAILGSISSDDTWLAFASDRTGRNEVWVERLDGEGTEFQVSVDGGLEPRFCRQCPMLFFRRATQWYGVRVPYATESEWGAPVLLWKTDFIDSPGRSYDVSPDGRRLLVSKRVVPDVADRIDIVQNLRMLFGEDVRGGAR